MSKSKREKAFKKWAKEIVETIYKSGRADAASDTGNALNKAWAKLKK